MITKLVTDGEYRDLIEWACNMDHGPWVAGGSVRKVWQGLPWSTQDVDFFFHDEDQFQRINAILPALGDEYKVEHDSNNAVTHKIYLRSGQAVKIQTIRQRFYPDVLSILENFDFNVSQFATDGVTMVSLPAALEDVESKRLRLNPKHQGQVKPLRVLKYAAYGFNPDAELLINAVRNINSGDLGDLGY